MAKFETILSVITWGLMNGLLIAVALDPVSSFGPTQGALANAPTVIVRPAAA